MTSENVVERHKFEKKQPDDCDLTYIACEIEGALYAVSKAKFFGPQIQIFLSGSPLGYFYYLLSLVLLMKQAS